MCVLLSVLVKALDAFGGLHLNSQGGVHSWVLGVVLQVDVSRRTCLLLWITTT